MDIRRYISLVSMETYHVLNFSSCPEPMPCCEIEITNHQWTLRRTCREKKLFYSSKHSSLLLHYLLLLRLTVPLIYSHRPSNQPSPMLLKAKFSIVLILYRIFHCEIEYLQGLQSHTSSISHHHHLLLIQGEGSPLR